VAAFISGSWTFSYILLEKEKKLYLTKLADLNDCYTGYREE
jgi:hypothetical protein